MKQAQFKPSTPFETSGRRNSRLTSEGRLAVFAVAATTLGIPGFAVGRNILHAQDKVSQSTVERTAPTRAAIDQLRADHEAGERAQQPHPEADAEARQADPQLPAPLEQPSLAQLQQMASSEHNGQ